MTLGLVDPSGRPFEKVRSNQSLERGEPIYLTFEEWCAKAIVTTNRAAWEYQAAKIDKIMDGWLVAVNAEVLARHQGLVEQLKNRTKELDDLKQFTEENILIIQQLEKKLGELGHVADLDV